MLGQQWHHIVLMLSHFRAILWFVLAFVGQELAYLGPFWATLANFGPRWHHIGLMLSAILGSVSAFALDLGISVSLNFCPCKAFAKNTTNTTEKTQFLGCVAGGFCCYVLVVFVSFFCGMLHLGYACLISGLCLAIVGYVGTILGSCWAILVYVVVCVGFCWARVGTILGLSWAILGYVGTFLATLALYLAHVEPF